MAGGNLPFGFAPSGSLTSYTPTLRERATDWMRKTLFSDDRAGQGRAEKVMDVVSMTPFGFGLDVYDAGREAGMGNYGTAAGTGLAVFAGPMAKTANHAALKLAKELDGAGTDIRKIWDETGWFKGADGNWRFEIDDSQFALKDSPLRPLERFGMFGRLDKTISHPLLFKAYGDDLPFELDLGTQGKRGGSMQGPTFWNTDMPERGVAKGDVQDMGRIRARGVDRDEVKSITLHELQHAIQNKEGFAQGGNVSDEAARIAAAKDAELLAQAEAMLTPSEKADLDRFRELKAQYEGADTIPGNVVIEANDLRKRLRNFETALDELKAFRARGRGGALEGGVVPREEAYDQYQRVAGEVESRNVEARRNMTPEQRRAIPPWETQEYPFALQLIR